MVTNHFRPLYIYILCLYFYSSIGIVSASDIEKGANEVSYVQVGRTYMSIKHGKYLIFDKQRLEKVYLNDSLSD